MSRLQNPILFRKSHHPVQITKPTLTNQSKANKMHKITPQTQILTFLTIWKFIIESKLQNLTLVSFQTQIDYQLKLKE